MALPDLSHEEAHKKYAAGYLDNRYAAPAEVADVASFRTSQPY